MFPKTLSSSFAHSAARSASPRNRTREEVDQHLTAVRHGEGAPAQDRALAADREPSKQDSDTCPTQQLTRARPTRENTGPCPPPPTRSATTDSAHRRHHCRPPRELLQKSPVRTAPPCIGRRTWQGGGCPARVGAGWSSRRKRGRARILRESVARMHEDSRRRAVNSEVRHYVCVGVHAGHA